MGVGAMIQFINLGNEGQLNSRVDLIFGFYAWQQARLLRLRFCNRIGQTSNVLTAAALACVLVHGVTDVTVFWPQTGMLLLLLLSSLSVGAEFLERELEPRPAAVPAGSRLRP